MRKRKTVAIIGAGPVGLAVAAHALEYGMSPIVLEAGPKVGHAIRQWGHVQMFSPWEYNINKASAKLLEDTGWTSPDLKEFPNGKQLVSEYLEPLATQTPLKSVIKTECRVTAVSRLGIDKVKTQGRSKHRFDVRYRHNNQEHSIIADAVVDASGTWSKPNPAGANGLPAIGEAELYEKISYAMPDVLNAQYSRYADKTVAVLGAGHSAAGILIDLVKLADKAPKTKVIWLVRGSNIQKAFGGGVNDQLEARGELGKILASLVKDDRIQIQTEFKVTHIDDSDNKLSISSNLTDRHRSIIADELIVATGFRPDLSFLQEVRLSLDTMLECPTELSPLIDPNVHSCGTVRPHGARELSHPESGFYIAGMKSYGRAPTFLLLTGYEQARSVVADIAGDKEAAERVELVLPETGVCSLPTKGEDSEATVCCGGPAKDDASACCVADEVAKASGGKGCGCSDGVGPTL